MLVQAPEDVDEGKDKDKEYKDIKSGEEEKIEIGVTVCNCCVLFHPEPERHY